MVGLPHEDKPTIAILCVLQYHSSNRSHRRIFLRKVCYLYTKVDTKMPYLRMLLREPNHQRIQRLASCVHACVEVKRWIKRPL